MRPHRLSAVGTVWIACLLLGACQGASNPSLLETGYEALDQKQYEQALATADEHLRQTPTGPGAAEASYLRGRALEQREKADDEQTRSDLVSARIAYEQALRFKPQPMLEGYILTSLANCSYFLGDYASAEKHWLAGYERLQTDSRLAELAAWVLYRVGLCQQRQGQFARADQSFEQVNERYPGTEAAARALEHQGARQFFVQVGAFQNPAFADALIAALRNKGYTVARVTRRDKGNLLRVMVGPLPDYPRAAAMRERVVADGFRDALIVP